ncbi:hypothetical protein NDU88_001836 [Pleurodeles waltl]|uniref:Uncharacterized protein n=1 Tax=Pleurodeles waltl TaxID=8319 RepID=A0AAV7NDQ2_PLEWA|nr:hypothetical protein NDU88_001836 [Pleurodeles waltl]
MAAVPCGYTTVWRRGGRTCWLFPGGSPALCWRSRTEECVLERSRVYSSMLPGPLGEVASCVAGEPLALRGGVVMASIPVLEPFVIDGHPSALAARWKEWLDRLETYFAAAAVENDRRRPMLLHLGGAAVHRLGRSVVEEGPPYTYQ